MENLKVESCVGCGFCCLKGKCSAGQRLYPSAKICPALIWSKESGRYFCDLMMLPGNLGFEYRKELFSGEGCCADLNTWRKDVKNRTEEIEKNEIFQLDYIFQMFIKALSSQEFLSPDVLHLTLHSLKAELQKDEKTCKRSDQIIKAIGYLIKNCRSNKYDSFIGEFKWD